MSASDLTKHEIIPDVIDGLVDSTVDLTVEYDGHMVDEIGVVYTPTIVQREPRVSWPAEDGTLYTICMTDPDAPSRATPKYREWHHWLVTNIRGTDIGSGEILSAYVGAGPPPKSGLHRYVILLFKQPGKIDVSAEPRIGLTTNGRGVFSISKFAKKHNLGNPIAVRMFQAEWDDYVPRLYQKLK